MQVFRPFFIQLNLPYSVIRGEVVAIQAIIFNYMSKEVTAELTFENIGDFQFIDNGVNDNEIARMIDLFSILPYPIFEVVIILKT
jgi:CD109 antigen